MPNGNIVACTIFLGGWSFHHFQPNKQLHVNTCVMQQQVVLGYATLRRPEVGPQRRVAGDQQESERASERGSERGRESCDGSTKQKQLLGDKEVDAASQVRGQRSAGVQPRTHNHGFNTAVLQNGE